MNFPLRAPSYASTSLSLLLLFAPIGAYAANVCGTAFDTLLFSGSFPRGLQRGSELGNLQASRTVKLAVGERPSQQGQNELVAELSSRGRCEASCKVRSLESSDHGRPLALFLECSDPAFDRLSAPITVLWPQHAGETTRVRLGTWVRGYQESEIRVEIDRYLTPSPRVEIAKFVR